MMRKLIYAACLLILSLLNAGAFPAPTLEEKAIARVKQTPVSELDAKLPATPFEKWLRAEAGADADIQWAVSDCGEGTGNPADQKRDLPMCVEADAKMKDRRSIVIEIAVGTSKKGLEGKPALFFGVLIKPQETTPIHHLSDLPAALSKTHPPEVEQ